MTPLSNEDLEYLQRAEAARRESQYQGARPHDVLQVSRSDVIVASVINAWRQGDCTWEQAMMHAVVSLSRQNERLMKDAVARMMREPPKPIFVADGGR